MCARMVQLIVQLCGQCVRINAPYEDQSLCILMPNAARSFGLIHRYVSHIAAAATCRYNSGDESTCTQPQINPLSDTENPPIH